MVDYLQFGNADWNVETASGSGFQRGAEHSGSDEEKVSLGALWRYHFLSLEHNMRLRLKVLSGESYCPSIGALCTSANWTSAS